MTRHRTSSSSTGRAGAPVRAKARSQQRNRWTGGKPGRGLYLPLADELEASDLPRLLAAAEKAMERNRKRLRS